MHTQLLSRLIRSKIDFHRQGSLGYVDEQVPVTSNRGHWAVILQVGNRYGEALPFGNRYPNGLVLGRDQAVDIRICNSEQPMTVNGLFIEKERARP